MTQKKTNINLAKIGMNKDTHPSQLDEQSFTHAKNANVENESGNSFNVKNEKSNILASKFKEGFVVINQTNDPTTGNTYFFLVNDETGVGEFGVIENNQNTNDLEDLTSDCGDCTQIKELAEPLEELTQVELQTYITLITDECHVNAEPPQPEKGFMFTSKNPIKKTTIKTEKCGKTIYFDQVGNPPRHINIDKINEYFIDDVACDDDIVLDCADFDRMRVFKLFHIPKLTPFSIELGGNLKMGMYEFLIAYCDSQGNEISEYYAITNPIAIFDKNNVILSQPQIADRTGFSIRLDLDELDEKFTHYKIAVIQSADIEGATRYFIEGIHPINDKTVVYSTEHNKIETSVDNLARVSLKVEEAEGLVSANNILYHYGVTFKKEINLQPVINLLGQYIKWQSHIAPETLYENGVASSLYLGYNRDETVPFGIKFLLEGGYETAVFPLIGRIATDEDLEDVVDEEGAAIGDNQDVASVLANKGDCNSTGRTKRWQYYNDATVDAEFCSNDIETITVTEEITRFCIVEDIATIASGTLSIELDTPFTGLEDYINENKGNSEIECDEAYENITGGNICDALYDDYSAIDCVENPFSDLDCGTPTVVTEEIEVQEIINEVVTVIPKDFATDYVKIVPPRICNMHVIDTTTGGSDKDDEFTTLYGSDTANTGNITGAYLRDSDFTEEECTYAAIINENQDPTTNNGAAYFNNYKATSSGAGDLMSTKNALNQNYVETLDFSSGTSGSVTVIINGTSFTTAFSGSLAGTALSFFTTHKIAIETLTGGILTNPSATTIVLTGAILYTIEDVNLTGDLFVNYTSIGYLNKLHKGALWFKGDTKSRTKFILDISKQKNKTPHDWVGTQTQIVRLSIFKNCSATTPIFSEYINLDNGAIFLLEKSGADLIITAENGTPYATIIGGWFSSKNFFITIDNSIIGKIIDINNSAMVEDYQVRWTTTPSKGCYSISTRNTEDKRVDITWDSIILRKKIELKATCSFEQPVLQACKAVPFKKGTFGYWESQETYADNNELYNSSNLVINEAQLPLEARSIFEEAFANVDVNGNYIWKTDLDSKELVNFTCRNIRHFKFPDNSISPFMYDSKQSPFTTSAIFPLGITINEEIINAFLNIAESNNLISKEDRSKITAYEIVRGDLRLNRSILSSGLLYDMREYEEKGQNVKYANYPFNSYSSDKLNNITQAGFGESNTNYSFHSPETDYERPTLTTEMTVQGYMYGNSRGHFDEVQKHPKWVILTDKARTLASTLATLEVIAEAVISAAQAFSNFNPIAGFSNTVFPGGIVASGIILAFQTISSAVFKYGRYRYEWLKIFQDLGSPYNFAYYYFAEGNYNYLQLEQTDGERLRALNVAKYLKEGDFKITNEVTAEKIKINNLFREKSVFLSTGDFPLTYPTNYKTYDKDNFTSSLTYSGEVGISNTGRSSEIQRNIASPYVALKNYLPQQHGTINTIKWLTTGYRGDLANPRTDCLSIFGGDTFISRHTLKRKHSQFLITSMGEADRTPFNYFFYNNIGKNPKFFVSYNIDKDFDGGGRIFPDIVNEFSLDNENKGGNYYRPPSKFYLYYYGIPNFLCESRINTNYRYAGKEEFENFYPQVGDLGAWTQEKNIPITTPNVFKYNKIYSKSVTPIKLRTLADNYNKDFNNCRTDFPNGVIASLPDNSENNSYDPWLIYRPLDFYEFRTDYGKLHDIISIEDEAVLARFENTSIIFNKVDFKNDDGQNTNGVFLGGNNIFFRRTTSLRNTTLGFAGTQNVASVSCEFGHFHTDAKRGQVIQVPPTGGEMEEISSFIGGKASGMRQWFKEHLPFKILKHLKDVDVDNNYNGVGIAMAWDSRFRRVFITKKDYVPKNPAIQHINGEYFLGETQVELTNTTYFEDVSWTIAYSPVLGCWMSFYDFKPNYYISHNNYFQSGVNQTNDITEFGLWSHGLTNKSYMVYYGKKYSFDIEYPIKAEFVTKTLNNVELWTEAKRYHNEYDWAINPTLTFNKSLIHNNVVCSGYLNLIPQKNNFVGVKGYPKTNNNGTQDIIITNKDNFKWGYDYFFNRVLNNTSNIPFINYDKNQIEKYIDGSIVKFKGKNVLDRMEGDWFLNRLSYDKDSRYSLTLKFTLNESEV